MKQLHIITPVKDSIELTTQTIVSVMASRFSVPFTYTVYNDFSTPENTQQLENLSAQYGFTLVNLSDITQNPSPNYRLVLQVAQQKAVEAEAGLCIVESDILVKSDTLQSLFDGAVERPDCGMAAAVTVDESGAINYPYLYAKGKEDRVFASSKHLSFCCSLLTLSFLRQYSFQSLDATKSWHDVTISHESLKQGFKNYLFTTLPVVHKPHGSRPWKQLKYTNPLKYYWLKIRHKRDKI